MRTDQVASPDMGRLTEAKIVELESFLEPKCVENDTTVEIYVGELRELLRVYRKHEMPARAAFTPAMLDEIIARFVLGDRMIMRRPMHTAIRKTDWRGVRPSEAAFEKLHKAGLISFNRAAGLIFWMIDTDLGIAVRERLMVEEES